MTDSAGGRGPTYDPPPITRDDPEPRGFRLGASVIWMPEQASEGLLTRPGLEPLAILTQRDDSNLNTVYRSALQAIHHRSDERAEQSLIALNTLAQARMPVHIMVQLVKESGMFTEEEIERSFRATPMGARILDEGREEGRERVYAGMLRARFGPNDQILVIARSLARMTEEQASRTVLTAQSLEELTQL